MKVTKYKISLCIIIFSLFVRWNYSQNSRKPISGLCQLAAKNAFASIACISEACVYKTVNVYVCMQVTTLTYVTYNINL